MDMLYAGTFEQDLKAIESGTKKIEITPECKKASDKIVDDVVQVLSQFGYQKGAEIFERMYK